MPISAVALANLREWTRSPVAEVIRLVLQKEIDTVYKERSDLLLPGDAIRTQEIRLGLLGKEQILQDMFNLLSLDPEAISEYLEDNGVIIVKTKEEEEIEKYGED